MEAYFATMFEDIRHERSLLLLLLSLTDPDILKQSKFTDGEINIKNLALEKFYRQRIIKEYHAVSLLEQKTII